MNLSSPLTVVFVYPKSFEFNHVNERVLKGGGGGGGGSDPISQCYFMKNPIPI